MSQVVNYSARDGAEGLLRLFICLTHDRLGKVDKTQNLFLNGFILGDIYTTLEISFCPFICCPSLVTLGTSYKAFTVYCSVFVAYFIAEWAHTSSLFYY